MSSVASAERRAHASGDRKILSRRAPHPAPAPRTSTRPAGYSGRMWFPALLLTLACPSDDTGSGPKDSLPPVDSAPELTSPGVVVENTDRDTGYRVSWTTSLPADARVEYGLDGAFDHSISLPSAPDGLLHEGLIASLAAGETWQLRAISVATEGTGLWTSDTFEINVPTPPADMPDSTLSVADATGSLDGFYLVTHALDGDAWVTIMDNEGRVVWWAEGDDDGQICEAWVTADGQFVAWMDMGTTPSLHRESIDGALVDDLPVFGLHHGFYPREDGGYAALLWDPRDYEGVQVIGDQLVEISSTGDIERVVWTSWDTWTPTAELVAAGGGDWTHANSVYYDADADEYVLSLRNLNAIVGIDQESGALVWEVGGTMPGAFTLTEGDGFVTQHGARTTDNGVILFNNRDYQDGEHDLWSEAVEYEVDWEAQTYRRLWTYDADLQVFSAVLGNAEPIDDGERLVAFGGAGRIVRLTDDNEILLQIDGDLGAPYGYVHWIPEFAGATR